MAWMHGHTLKFASMLVLVFLYFLVELIVGHVVKSITLVADAFHMLSDFIGLGVAIVARRIGKWPKSRKNTFGWQRAEVVGTLTNTVVLTTLTFTILVESIQKFLKPEPVNDPKLLLFVGIGGLVVNLIGLIVLRGDHGHSHGNEGHDEPVHNDDDTSSNRVQIVGDGVKTNENDVKIIMANNDSQYKQSHKPNNRVKRSAGRMNMQAAFLHVLADFFGSVAVVVSALILWLVPGNSTEWKNYIDPSISLVMVVLILSSAVPLLKRSALILLQSVPKEISVEELETKIKRISGIERVHDLHVWLLQSDVIIGTVHIGCSKDRYVQLSREVKKLFHDSKVHCTTIQPEFDEHADESNSNSDFGDSCALTCSNTAGAVAGQPGNACTAMQSCCPTKVNSTANFNTKVDSVLLKTNAGNTQESLPITLCASNDSDVGISIAIPANS